MVGKSPVEKRLVVWCLDEQSYEDWKDLEEKGHQVIPVYKDGPRDTEPNLVVGESASFWTKGMDKFRESTIKRARDRKGGKK